MKDKQNLFLTIALIIVSFIAVTFIATTNILIIKYKATEDNLNGLITQMCVSYEVKVQECNELQQENDNLKTYISTLERYSEK